MNCHNRGEALMNEHWAGDCTALVGGHGPLIDKTIEMISEMVNHQNERHANRLSNVLGILFEGLSGVGKFYLAQSLAETSGLPWKIVKLEEFFQCSASEIGAKILEAFTDDIQLYVVENVDLLVGRLLKDSGDFERTILEVFGLLFDRLSASRKSKIIIGTTSSLDRIDPSWLCGTRFSALQRVTVSKPEQRQEILQILLKGLLDDGFVRELAWSTHGYTVADLRGLTSGAVCSSKGAVTMEDFVKAKQVVRPSMMAEYFAPLPTASIDDLVGIDSIEEHLRELIITPIRKPALAEKYRLDLPKGILIHGPTGSGKTHLAQGLVREAGLNYIPVSATSIRSKYVGQSEKNLAALFKQARDCAPSILLIDQIDALVSKRGASSTSDNSGNRLVTCFLTEIDGLAAKGSNSSVLVIGITDSIRKMDDAMIRPGRLGVHIEMPRDLSKESRRQFFSKCKLSLSLTDAQIDAIANRTEGYTGARMDWLVREAAMSALDDGSVTFSHLSKVLDK